MAGPIRLYFDAWAAATPKGTALGELTQAYEKKIQDVLADVGSGEFVVNRHDSQAVAGWVDTGNLIRVRLEAGGPFAWDDARYVFAFYIEDGDDELVSPDEEAGEEWQRGGRGILSVLDRLIWWSSSFTNPDGDAWILELDQGAWIWEEGQSIGRPLNRAIREYNARPNTPIPASLSKDFTVSVDSAGAAWDTADEDLSFDIGDPYLKTFLEYRDLDVEAAMTPAFVARAWNDNGKGADKTATVVFRKGWNIREGGSRPKYAPTRSSRALVRGKSKEDAGPKYVEATYSGTAADESGKWGRRETLVPYGRTRSTAILEKAGKRALRRLKRLEEGPPTMGVTSYPKGSGSQSDGGTPAAIRDLLPYTDYETGDTVTVDIPGEYSNYEARITAISITDGENGEADVDLTFDDTAYDPVSAAGSGHGNPTGGGSGGRGCGHCLKLCKTTSSIFTDLTWKVLEHASQTSGEINPEPADWKEPGFDDSSWDDPIEKWYAGAFAANVEDEGGTIISGPNGSDLLVKHEHFLRKDFWIEESELTGADIQFEAACDDGLIVYVNGVQVLSLGTQWSGGGELTHSGTLPRSTFQAGLNCIAIYLWNQDGGSDGLAPNPGPTVAGVFLGIQASDHALGSSDKAAACDHGHLASEISVADSAGLLTGADVEAALAELAAHPPDSSDAHDASAISIADAGGYFTGADVEAALQELGAGGGGGGGNVSAPIAVTVDLGAAVLMKRRAAVNAEDDLFDSTTLAAKWLTYRTGAAVDLTTYRGWLNAGGRALIQPVPAGDWTIECEVLPTGSSGPSFQNEGLILTNGTSEASSTDARFGWGMNNSLTNYRWVFEKFVNAAFSSGYLTNNTDTFPMTGPVFLRIIKTGTTYAVEVGVHPFGEFYRFGSTSSLGFTPTHFGLAGTARARFNSFHRY